MVGVGVGEGVTEGGGLNFGPGHPARRIQVRSNSPGDLGTSWGGRVSPRAGKAGRNAKTYFSLRLENIRSFANQGSRGSDDAILVEKRDRPDIRLCRTGCDPSQTLGRKSKFREKPHGPSINGLDVARSKRCTPGSAESSEPPASVFCWPRMSDQN